MNMQPLSAQHWADPRFICCNAGRGVAVIFDYSLNCIRTKESDEICTVTPFYREFVRAL